MKGFNAIVLKKHAGFLILLAVTSLATACAAPQNPLESATSSVNQAVIYAANASLSNAGTMPESVREQIAPVPSSQANAWQPPRPGSAMANAYGSYSSKTSIMDAGGEKTSTVSMQSPGIDTIVEFNSSNQWTKTASRQVSKSRSAAKKFQKKRSDKALYRGYK